MFAGVNSKFPIDKPHRVRSISENYPKITHPHDYEGILKITRSSQTSPDLGVASLWSEKFKRKNSVSTQTPDLIPRKIHARPRIVTNPRMRN